MVLLMKIGEKIALCRKKAGLSQEELSDRLKLSRQAVSRWETGAATPDTEKVIQLSRLFGVSTDYLLLDELKSPEASPALAGNGPEETSVGKEALLERRRHFRIAFGVAATFLGLFTAVAALFLTQFYADTLTEWHTSLGRFGTALTETWRGGLLFFGILLFAVGAAVLIREYVRKD